MPITGRDRRAELTAFLSKMRRKRLAMPNGQHESGRWTNENVCKRASSEIGDRLAYDVLDRDRPVRCLAAAASDHGALPDLSGAGRAERHDVRGELHDQCTAPWPSCRSAWTAANADLLPAGFCHRQPADGFRSEFRLVGLGATICWCCGSGCVTIALCSRKRFGSAESARHLAGTGCIRASRITVARRTDWRAGGSVLWLAQCIHNPRGLQLAACLGEPAGLAGRLRQRQRCRATPWLGAGRCERSAGAYG